MQTLEEVVEFLIRNQLMLTTAESCTAGLMCSLLADVSGCGKVLESGYVTYTVGAKHSMLGSACRRCRPMG